MIKENSNQNETGSIYDVAESDFTEKVVELSASKLIIVDFWAPWCQPCKQLTPILENVIKKSKDRVFLAKINIDDNQQIAAQFRIQSIPTVIAFKDKKIVNAFQGVLPENQIIDFIEKILGEKLEKDNSVFYDEINNLFKDKNFKVAIALLEDFIVENSDDKKGIKLYLECLISLSKFGEAKSFISSLSENIQKTNEIKSVITQLNLKESSASGPSLSDIEINLKNDPKNLNLAIELSDKYFSKDMINESFELLLKMYPKKNEKDKDKIKKVLVKYFEALGDDNEYTKSFRKKFSSMMFS
tara:strand:+ start:311 stop:1210 length:900 start_codon:yes stop_codon:yes gene_type:complete